jgi:hypothetical protein
VECERECYFLQGLQARLQRNAFLTFSERICYDGGALLHVNLLKYFVVSVGFSYGMPDESRTAMVYKLQKQ